MLIANNIIPDNGAALLSKDCSAPSRQCISHTEEKMDKKQLWFSPAGDAGRISTIHEDRLRTSTESCSKKVSDHDGHIKSLLKEKQS